MLYMSIYIRYARDEYNCVKRRPVVAAQLVPTQRMPTQLVPAQHVPPGTRLLRQVAR
jgi:hypothetical protein